MYHIYIDQHIYNLEFAWSALKDYEKPTYKQIESINDGCIRMYSYFYCDHPNFYDYKKKNLLNRYINYKNDNLLLFAAALGKINKLKYLVSHGFDINYKNMDGINAYLIASQFGQIEMLKYLDTTCIDKNIKDCDGNNAYLYAYLYDAYKYEYK